MVLQEDSIRNQQRARVNLVHTQRHQHCQQLLLLLLLLVKLVVIGTPFDLLLSACPQAGRLKCSA
jgi:hypothetical protein